MSVAAVVHQTARGSSKFRSESKIQLRQSLKNRLQVRPCIDTLSGAPCPMYPGFERIGEDFIPIKAETLFITDDNNGGVSLLIEKGAASALAGKGLSTVEVLMLLTAALRQIQLPPAEREGWWL